MKMIPKMKRTSEIKKTPKTKMTFWQLFSRRFVNNLSFRNKVKCQFISNIFASKFNQHLKDTINSLKILKSKY